MMSLICFFVLLLLLVGKGVLNRLNSLSDDTVLVLERTSWPASIGSGCSNLRLIDIAFDDLEWLEDYLCLAATSN